MFPLKNTPGFWLAVKPKAVTPEPQTLTAPLSRGHHLHPGCCASPSPSRPLASCKQGRHFAKPWPDTVPGTAACAPKMNEFGAPALILGSNLGASTGTVSASTCFDSLALTPWRGDRESPVPGFADRRVYTGGVATA